jgi:hypothetical protein
METGRVYEMRAKNEVYSGLGKTVFDSESIGKKAKQRYTSQCSCFTDWHKNPYTRFPHAVCAV